MSWKWIVWAFGSALALGVFTTLMFAPDAMESLPIERTVFLPGETTDGHYQIELDCDACHTEAFADTAGMQEACVGCHGVELELAIDSHPQTKFSDPRNADRIEVLDARWCITCHQEHRPEVTSTMGLSLPVDYCFRCHEDVGEERPTHEGLAFDSCASSGCHNFHDNRALYEDFLVEHRDEAIHRVPAQVPERELLAWALERGFAKPAALRAEDHDAPADLAELERWVGEWAGTSHAAAGVNCSGCHAPDGSPWQAVPEPQACKTCHAPEHAGFAASRHGMRAAAGLEAMKVADARLPMHAEAAEAELGCNSCHGAHAYDTRVAASERCQGCHADEHTLAYEASPHAGLWRAELSGAVPPGTGVSCATCHLPRMQDDLLPERMRVSHNQNDFLRPNDKMVRPVCMQCHGLGFALDSLADPALVKNNFKGQPVLEVESIHYAARLRWELEGRTPPWFEEEEPR